MNSFEEQLDLGRLFDLPFAPADSTLGAFAPEFTVQPDIYGSPVADAADFSHQTTPFTCAVVSQQMILKQYGYDVSEAQLVYDATSHGWLTDHGTAPEDAGRLLEFYGVGTHTHVGGDIEHLIAELARGHKVIAAVDSGEIWGRDWFFEDWLNADGADHALVITGVDLSDRENPRVFVNDPGNPDGAGKAYPLEQFLDAWDDSGRYFIATDDAPPDLAAHSIFGPAFGPGAGLYLDREFWMELAARVAGVVAAAAVATLLDRALDADTVGDAPMRTIEHLTETQRDQLFCRI